MIAVGLAHLLIDYSEVAAELRFVSLDFSEYSVDFEDQLFDLKIFESYPRQLFDMSADLYKHLNFLMMPTFQ